ncbi:MAG: PTS sugar transporter subunit IIA [Victivallaceae bacterium]|nr:PTS sugar transporter subunit IIA [Victivallaceae bacterium]
MKNDFSQFVTKESILSLSGRNKLEVMDQLITRAAELSKLDRDVIFRLIWKREQMMTTGVGGQLALPHIRANDILHPFVLIGICETPITDYQGQDDQPVRVIVFTVAPDENQEDYLQLLSSISRRFRNSDLITKLIETDGRADDVYALIHSEE